ncbi:MAG: LCP family protein [Streptococcaceae bacterium]|jgi:LCP family protein required for cell wall assembly|nr:LCP family protein [Streptococcaceae bacterium]
MSRKKKIILVVLSIFTVLEIAAAGVGFKIYLDAKKAMNGTFVQVKRKYQQKEKVILATEPFSVLLLGIDSGEGLERDSGKWDGRADSMMLVVVNPKKKQTTVLSFPRDLYVLLDGPDDNEYTGVKDKINHAFARGKEGMSMDTVAKLIDIKIDYVIAVNMIGFPELVDDVGGLTIDAKFGTVDGKHLDRVPVPDDLAALKGLIPSDEPMRSWEAQHYGYNFDAIFQWISEGKQKMDGRTATNYARYRHGDDGTYGRDARQRQVSQKLVEKLFSINSFTKYKKIFKTISGNIRTNLAWKDLVRIRKTYPLSLFKHAVSLQLPGVGDMINGASYQLVPKNLLLQAQNYMREQMGLPANATLGKQLTYESVTGLKAPEDASLNLLGEKKKTKTSESSSKVLDEEQSEVTGIEGISE